VVSNIGLLCALWAASNGNPTFIVIKQRVKINGFYSDWADVLSGIPQRIILGHILFIIYIDDLPDVCASSLLTSICLQTTLSYISM